MCENNFIYIFLVKSTFYIRICVSKFMWQAFIGAQPERFQGRGGLVVIGNFYKHFVKNTRKKASQRKIWEFVLLDTLKTTFWKENIT